MFGGHDLDNLNEIERMLTTFWQRYANVDAEHVPCPHRTIPWMLHGDEGQGQVRRPILVISFQPLIGWAGEDSLNSSRMFGFS